MWVRIKLLVALVVVFVVATPLAAGASTGTFIDDDRSRFEGFIETASQAGLVNGCNPPANDRFCPHRVVTRAEMAMMLDRILELPAPETDHFQDDNGLTAEQAINALAQAGVTSGCGPSVFCPDRPLSRGELAALITGTLDWDLLQIDPYRYLDLEGSRHGRALATLASHDGLDPCDPPEGRRLCPTASVTRDEAVFALSKALTLDPSPPGGSHTALEVGFHDDFQELRLWDGRSPSSRNRVRLTEGGYRGTGLKVGVPRGSHFGADFKLDLSDVVGEEPEALFFRYYLRFDPSWKAKASGKLPGFSGIYGHTGKGGYRSSPSTPGWSARMKFSGNRPDDPRARLGFYVYHLGQERRYGDGMNWNEAGKLQPGEWYCIEGQVELNTPGLADGALRAWVDGTPAFDEAGIEFRRPSEPEIKVESFWFNVYYGGKPVAPADMGLTVDEVAVDGTRIGCDSGPGIATPVGGDLNGNGFEDQVWWGDCDAKPCFLVRQTDQEGHAPTVALGEGAWFSLETHRVGIATLDLDGDGDDDILYRGRCGRSRPCWRTHRVEGGRATPGLDWGDGARFSAATRSLVTGDWDGDGRDDLVYAGLCGSAPAHPCWRAHLNGEKGFAPPADWGPHPEGFDSVPEAADFTADGRDDILFAAPCDEETCWYIQVSTGKGFEKPMALGPAREPEMKRRRLFDFNGDGRADLLAVRQSEEGSIVEVRYTTAQGFDESRRLIALGREITDVTLRRTGIARRPVEALAITDCEDPRGCVLPLVTLSGKLVTEGQYNRAMTVRLIQAMARPPAPLELIYQ
jgi:hypothetical protein